MIANYALLKRKDNGGLQRPSEDVVTVCQVTEKVLRGVAARSPDGMPSGSVMKIVTSEGIVARSRERNAFSSLDSHMLDTDPCENHVYRLIRVVAQSF